MPPIWRYRRSADVFIPGEDPEKVSLVYGFNLLDIERVMMGGNQYPSTGVFSDGYPVPQKAPSVKAGMNGKVFPERFFPKATGVNTWYGVYYIHRRPRCRAGEIFLN